MDYKKKSIELFIEHTDFTKNDILNINQIHNGFTNISFLVVTKNKQKFQIRIGGSNHVVNRRNEELVLQTISNNLFVYYNHENGDAIKKWIYGINPGPNELDDTFLKALSIAIRNLHNTDIVDTKIIKHDSFCFFDKVELEIKHKKMYVELIKKYDYLPLVLSHNDINTRNLIYSDKKVFLIDFEWSRINNEYWDLANFIREEQLPLNKIIKLCDYYGGIKLEILKDFIYLTTNFAVQWTYCMVETPKILEYRKKQLILMEHYYGLLFN